jgi:hypothetical protein
MPQTMNFEQTPHDEELDPLEDTELARRLRRMEWPAAPTDVKQRCLEEILSRVNSEDEQ